MLYTYDLAGQLIAANDNSAAITAPATAASFTQTASYDALSRPLAISWTPAAAQTTPTASSASFAFTYDANNRRISQTATDNSWWSYPAAVASNTSYTANNLNQYTAVGAVTPTYDGNGNFTYDAQGRRKSKTVGAVTTYYVTDANNREVLEYDNTGAIQRWYSFGNGIDQPLNQMNVAAGTRATLIPDIQGSLIGALASSGTLTKTGFQPFGQNPSLASNGFYYTGRRLDPETAGSSAQPSGLYYYRARMYSPTWGRFNQPDMVGYSGGANLYTYTDNDPTDLTDPSGNCPWCVGAVVGGAVEIGVELYNGELQNAYHAALQGNFAPALKSAARIGTSAVVGAATSGYSAVVEATAARGATAVALKAFGGSTAGVVNYAADCSTKGDCTGTGMLIAAAAGAVDINAAGAAGSAAESVAERAGLPKIAQISADFMGETAVSGAIAAGAQAANSGIETITVTAHRK